MTHLGNRVSALLDGQLGPDEEERAWAHVHGCHTCRDLVEHEGWVKTQLLGLSREVHKAPLDLKGVLGDPHACADRLDHCPEQPRRYGMVALGGGAVGAAFLGVLALTALPGSAPTAERQPPVSSVSTPATRAPVPALVTASNGAAGVVPAVDRVGPHHGQAGLSGVRMAP